MIPSVEEIEDCVYHNPLLLLSNKYIQFHNLVNPYLKFSIGFEIECGYGQYYEVNNFKKIPNIIDVINDAGEQRYRIKNGVQGLLTLYYLSTQLKRNSAIQDSGIHYHVKFPSHIDIDLTDNRDYILKELDTWNYKGNYNTRDTSYTGGHYWARRNGQFDTLEIRIGEMTFDYELLIKRIIHVSEIMHNLCLMNNIKCNYSYEEINIVQHIDYIKDIINYTPGLDVYKSVLLQNKKHLDLLKVNPKRIIDNRTIKLDG
jgi:hypothetical protein